MRRSSTVVVAMLAIAAAHRLGAGTADTIVVELRRAEGVELAEDLELLVEAADGKHPARSLNISGDHRVEAPRADRVGCRAARLWCPWRVVAPGQSLVVLPVFRGGGLKGRVVPTREGAPDALVVEGTVDVPGLGAVPFQQDLSTSDDGRFALAAPQAELDLRFSAVGWAPLYRWSLEVGGEATDLGNLRFARGSSVTGFVRYGVTELPAAGAMISALPASADELDEAARGRLDALARPVQTDPWGFFQLGGLPPGRYRLRIAKDGFYPARSPLIEVVAESETRLSDEIDLLPAFRASFSISPRQPREGEGWQVRLLGQNGRNPSREAVADEAGVAIFEGLPPGTYRARVRSEQHPSVWDRALDLASDRTVEIDLQLLQISGHVTLSEDPLPARVTIGTGSMDKWRYRSDEEGRFAGMIHRPEHDVLFVRIEADEPKLTKEIEIPRPRVEDDVLELEISLEDRVVEGSVVDWFGEPVVDAEVDVNEGAKLVARVPTDRDGGFSARGLHRGRYRVSARARERGSSEVVEADLTVSERAGPFRLTLVSKRRVDGVVRTADGRPVQGAQIQALTWSPVPLWGSGTSDLAGRFWVEVPEGARHAHLQIEAPSLGLIAICSTLPPDEEALEIDLPSTASATLELDFERSPDLPPPMVTALSLLRRDGGFLSIPTMTRWSVAQGSVESEDLTVRGLFPGQYALAWLDGPSWARAAAACEPALGPERSWRLLGPGQTLRLRYDLEPHQRSAAVSDSGEAH